MKAERIAVAMSGGVDSSVAAALLKREGHEVVGLTMRVVDSSSEFAPGRCCSPRDIEDARAIARKLGIPHYVIDLRKMFEKEVIRPFARAYARGITPNPCVVCNRLIKFGALARKAREIGATAFATGHHARVIARGGRMMIARGRDKSRDQSYFLFKLAHDDLEFVRFPVGELVKSDVRRIAREMGLVSANKRESREVCFVPGDDYVTVVEKYAERLPEPGEITLSDGEVVGWHKGVHRFTIGQRRGLNVALGKPMYVTGLDAEAHRVIVGPKDQCRSSGLVARDLVWNYHIPITESMEAEVQIRYKTRPIRAKLFPSGEDGVRAMFSEAGPMVTPGQAAVFYTDDVVLGGAWIEERIP